MNKLVVLGYPVGHSLSPPMQNAALQAMGLGGTWSYEAIEVEPGAFEGKVRELVAAGYRGANVTLPHKVAALNLSAEATGQARRIGAANTLTFNPDGTVSAANSDAPGFLASLPKPPHPARETAVVLGAGGTARAVVCALTDAGVRTRIWNRTHASAVALAEEFGPAAGAITSEEWSGISAAGNFDLLVNTTSIGLRQPGENSQFEDDLKALGVGAGTLLPRHTCVDLVYGTEPTALARAASAAGADFVDGLEILVWQGAISLEIWTGMEVPVGVMRDTIRELTGSG